jgi:hypothetical protein
MRLRSIVAGVAVSALLPGMALAYTGVFRASATQDTGSSNPTGIAVGDFDADGAVDAVMPMAGLGGNALYLFAGLKSCVGGESDTLRCAGDRCPGGNCEQRALDRFRHAGSHQFSLRSAEGKVRRRQRMI